MNTKSRRNSCPGKPASVMLFLRRHAESPKEALIESGASRLSCKIVQFKAQTARNSQAIVKGCNAEMDDFTP